MNRREFLLTTSATGLAGALAASSTLQAKTNEKPFFKIRGAVLRPDEASETERFAAEVPWERRAEGGR